MILVISQNISISNTEIEMTAIRAQGAGGQNVNKVSSAIHLRFDINRSSLPPSYKERLLLLGDYRISGDGVIVIKAQRYRTQEKNRADALLRLQQLIEKITITQKTRRPTKATRASQHRRLDSKTKRGDVKKTRRFKTDEKYL